VINGQSVLSVIPARSGSKRCPGKNFLPYKGRTLVEWALEAASNSRYIDRIVISKDEDRPPELCTDEATCEDVLRFHHKDEYWCVLLQPTSPNRTTEDIDKCIERAQLGWGCISTLMGKTNGAVYVAAADWLKDHDFSHAGLLKYEMEDSHSLDINYQSDFSL
jgi:CMP-N-acetylneuraminic acid synthetase